MAAQSLGTLASFLCKRTKKGVYPAPPSATEAVLARNEVDDRERRADLVAHLFVCQGTPDQRMLRAQRADFSLKRRVALREGRSSSFLAFAGGGIGRWWVNNACGRRILGSFLRDLWVQLPQAA